MEVSMQITSENLLRDSLYEIVKVGSTDLSLTYAQASGKTFYSFLNFGWGFVADVDIESEKYRSLGYARFTFGCAVRVANLRRYHGMISYLPADGSIIHQAIKHHNEESSNRERGTSFIHRHAPSLITSTNQSSRGTDFASTLASESERINKSYAKSDPEFHKRDLYNSDQIHSEAVQSCEISNTTNTEISINDISPVEDAPIIDHCITTDGLNETSEPYHLQSSLVDPLPDGWSFLEGNFVWVTPVCLSHIGQDMYMMPSARLDDEIMYLYCLKSEVTKLELARILLSIEKGNHLGLAGENTVLIPCKAFRLEPFSNHTGYMTSDGELIPHGPLQASVTSVKAKVMCSRCPKHVNVGQ